jgi:hypothetical protein
MEVPRHLWRCARMRRIRAYSAASRLCICRDSWLCHELIVLSGRTEIVQAGRTDCASWQELPVPAGRHCMCYPAVDWLCQLAGLTEPAGNNSPCQLVGSGLIVPAGRNCMWQLAWTDCAFEHMLKQSACMCVVECTAMAMAGPCRALSVADILLHVGVLVTRKAVQHAVRQVMVAM